VSGNFCACGCIDDGRLCGAYALVTWLSRNMTITYLYRTSGLLLPICLAFVVRSEQVQQMCKQHT